MFKHETVLLNESINELKITGNGNYVDCTLGGGGHSSRIISKLTTGNLFAFDQDQVAIDFNTVMFAKELKIGNFHLIHSNFRNIHEKLSDRNITGVDGIIYDLGVSSPQLDDPSRGFSYRYDAPLDMRMDQTSILTAKDVVNNWSYQDLISIFYRYAGERFAKPIARKIEKYRKTQRIETTSQLVSIIKEGIPAATRRHGGHPAKKIFQAIRIAVNDELRALESSLKQALSLLNSGGRISVITFQSLEDQIVKSMFKEKSSLPKLPPHLPVIPEELKPEFTLVTRKYILPGETEMEENHRSHSAKLSVIEKN